MNFKCPIPQEYFDFVEQGGILPEDNGFLKGPVKDLSYKEKIYKVYVYERDEDFRKTEELEGIYHVKYVDVVKDGFHSVVWLTEVGCFASIDDEYANDVMCYDWLNWNEVLEQFNTVAASIDGETFESMAPDIPMYDEEGNEI